MWHGTTTLNITILIFTEYVISENYGCCTHRTGEADGGLHRYCYVSDQTCITRNTCKAHCDRDSQCKGFDVQFSFLPIDSCVLNCVRCFLATTGDCPDGWMLPLKGCDLGALNNVGELLVDGDCGDMAGVGAGKEWCFIKKRGK